MTISNDSPPTTTLPGDPALGCTFTGRADALNRPIPERYQRAANLPPDFRQLCVAALPPSADNPMWGFEGVALRANVETLAGRYYPVSALQNIATARVNHEGVMHGRWSDERAAEPGAEDKVELKRVAFEVGLVEVRHRGSAAELVVSCRCADTTEGRRLAQALEDGMKARLPDDPPLVPIGIFVAGTGSEQNTAAGGILVGDDYAFSHFEVDHLGAMAEGREAAGDLGAMVQKVIEQRDQNRSARARDVRKQWADAVEGLNVAAPGVAKRLQQVFAQLGGGADREKALQRRDVELYEELIGAGRTTGFFHLGLLSAVRRAESLGPTIDFDPPRAWVTLAAHLDRPRVGRPVVEGPIGKEPLTDGQAEAILSAAVLRGSPLLDLVDFRLDASWGAPQELLTFGVPWRPTFDARYPSLAVRYAHGLGGKLQPELVAHVLGVAAKLAIQVPMHAKESIHVALHNAWSLVAEAMVTDAGLEPWVVASPETLQDLLLTGPEIRLPRVGAAPTILRPVAVPGRPAGEFLVGFSRKGSAVNNSIRWHVEELITLGPMAPDSTDGPRRDITHRSAIGIVPGALVRLFPTGL